MMGAAGAPAQRAQALWPPAALALALALALVRVPAPAAAHSSHLGDWRAAPSRHHPRLRRHSLE